MRINFLTIFPEIFNSYLNESILKRAQGKKLVKFNIVNIRDFATDPTSPRLRGAGKHRIVDDSPYGGGAGMVMKVEPIFKALQALKKFKVQSSKFKNRTILLSAKGKLFAQKDAARLAKYNELTFICGRYEGVDERVKKFVDEEISIGEYVLTGGELPAMVIADAVTRLIPGVIRAESLSEESFSGKITNYKLLITNYREYPQYTRPKIFEYRDLSRGASAKWGGGKKKLLKVPSVLLSGDHKKIKEWRDKSSK